VKDLALIIALNLYKVTIQEFSEMKLSIPNFKSDEDTSAIINIWKEVGV